MKTLTEQYRLIKEDKGHKGVFLKEAKRQFPNLIKNNATFNEASKILKSKNIISENFVGTPMIGNPIERKKEGFENAFANFLAEAETKAEEKKVSKEVEEIDEHNYDYEDKKMPNNMIFGQVQMGYYCEYKDPKNEGKNDHELLEIVYKNLAKDPIFYTKNGQFGEKDLGYTDEAPSLGEPVEPKGEYKSSGYGKLKEHSIAVAGGIVTGTGFSHKNYMDYFDLHEETPIPTPEDEKRIDRISDKMKDLKNLEEDDISENIRPEVFQKLDGLMPLSALQTLMDEISTAYNSIEDARDAVQTIFADKEIRDYEFDASDIVEYLIIQSQNALGRDSDLNLIKRLIGHSTS
tara:strand:+ start:179 stop:1222 length:1044 start_codon:yes stop_codon:yes gene_type:complete